MSEIKDLLEQALAAGDRAGVRFVGAQQVDSGLLGRVAELTYEHLREHAHLSEDGAIVSDTSVLGWWTREANLTKEQRNRVHTFRSDVVRNLASQGLVQRRNPRSRRLYLTTGQSPPKPSTARP